MVARCLLRIGLGQLPPQAQAAFLAAHLVGLAKKDGGTRILGRGGTPRRMVGRAAAKVLASEIAAAVGPQQQGLAPDGAAAVHRLLSAHVGAHPDTGVLSMDIANAFTAVNRDVALDAVRRKAPQLYAIVYHWLKTSTEHVPQSMDAENPVTLTQHVGLDQGCPLSPAVYCITVADPLAHIERVMRDTTVATAVEQWQAAQHQETPPPPDVSAAATGEGDVVMRRAEEPSTAPAPVAAGAGGQPSSQPPAPGIAPAEGADVVLAEAAPQQQAAGGPEGNTAPQITIPAARLARLAEEAQSNTRTMAFMDDTYLAGPIAALLAGYELFKEVMGSLGLTINESKTKFWAPHIAASDSVPELERFRVTSLKAMGTSVPYAKASANPRSTRLQLDDDEDDRTDVSLDVDLLDIAPEDFVERQRDYCDRLINLCANGLPVLHALKLLQVWSQGAAVHIMRAAPIDTEWARAVDADIVQTVNTLVHFERCTHTQRSLIFTPKKLGGLGMGSAEARYTSAWLGAWEGGLHHVTQALGITTTLELHERWPAFMSAAARHTAIWKRQTHQPLPEQRWTACLRNPQPKRQGQLQQQVNTTLHKLLLSTAAPETRGCIQSCEGREASAFMDPPENEQPIPDDCARVALRLRLNAAYPVEGASAVCQNKVQGGRCCGRACPGDHGHHALTCRIGGAVLTRHNRIRDVLAEWLKSQGIGANTEQSVPEWDTPREQARLDVAYFDSRHGERFIDVAVLAAHTHKGLAAQIRLERHERKKHTRYPGPRLIPFVLDVRGLWGKEACAWARAMVRRLPKADRAAALQDLRWRVSQALQLAVAEQCLRALRPTKRQPNLQAEAPASQAGPPAEGLPSAERPPPPVEGAAAPAPLDGCDVPIPESSSDDSDPRAAQEGGGPGMEQACDHNEPAPPLQRAEEAHPVDPRPAEADDGPEAGVDAGSDLLLPGAAPMAAAGGPPSL